MRNGVNGKEQHKGYGGKSRNIGNCRATNLEIDQGPKLLNKEIKLKKFSC
jgi:hypothetical protein